MADTNVCRERFYFLLSGENPELAVYEFKCVLSILDIQPELTISPDSRIIEVEWSNDEKIPRNLILFILNRVTLTHFCCKQIFQFDFTHFFPQSFSDLVSIFDSVMFQNLTPNQTFSVKTKRIGEPLRIFHQSRLTQDLSSYIGSQILQVNTGSKVNLNHPKIKFMVILNNNGIWFGRLISESKRNEVRQRSSHKRPFFHPSSMNPLLQRTLINLAALRPGDWLLDPFCGSGGALLEAARFGIRSVGVEIDRRILWGAYKNLIADIDTKKSTHLIFGDATQLGIKRGTILGIVTDPPYGTAASTQGIALSQLLLDFFREARQILKSKCRIVIAVPSNIKIEEDASQILNASYVKFLHYVHRSLTRKILVFTLK